MIRQIASSHEPLTKELAMTVSQMNAANGERPLKLDRVKWLKAKLEDGLFYAPQWAFADLGGKRYRVNGQHSSTMLSLQDVVIPKDLKVVLLYFAVDSLLELAELFQQFDTRNSMRSATEVVMAHARSEQSLNDYSAACIRYAVDARAVHHKLTEGVALDLEERARLSHGSIDFVQWCQELYSGEGLRRAVVGAAMYATFLAHAEFSKRFWLAVRHESHAAHTHPTRVLGRFLREQVHRGIRSSSTSKTTYTEASNYERCVHAWNACVEGRELKLVRAYGNKVQLVIPLTPASNSPHFDF